MLVINAESDTQAHIVLPEVFDQLHLNAARLSADEMAERIQARLDDAAGGMQTPRFTISAWNLVQIL